MTFGSSKKKKPIKNTWAIFELNIHTMNTMRSGTAPSKKNTDKNPKTPHPNTLQINQKKYKAHQVEVFMQPVEEEAEELRGVVLLVSFKPRLKLSSKRTDKETKSPAG